jgi:hypothetical protein
MNKKLKTIITLLIILLGFVFLFSLSSCKKKAEVKDDVFIIENEEVEEPFYELDDEEEEINWDKEKERLKGVGKLDIRTFSIITVIISREIKDLETKLKKQNFMKVLSKNR